MPQVHNNFESSRFDIYSAGDVAASVHYRMNGAEISFIYTEVNRTLQTPLLVQALIRGCLDYAHHRRLAVLPFCPTIWEYIRHHSQYASLVPLSQRKRFGLPLSSHPPRRTLRTAALAQ